MKPPRFDYFEPRTVEEPQVVPTYLDDVIPDVRPDRGIPGWKPTVPLQDGVKAAVRWYAKHGVENTYTHLKVTR